MMMHCIRKKPPCELNISCTSTTAESVAKIWYQLKSIKAPQPPPPPPDTPPPPGGLGCCPFQGVGSVVVGSVVVDFLFIGESVIVLYFVVRYFMSILVLQSF